MLIGNRNRLAIGIEPLVPSWDRQYLPEYTAWAQLSFWINGENICRNLLDGSNSVRDAVNVPLAPIADWLVRSWTFLEFEERPSSYPLHASLRDTITHWGDAPAPAGLSEDEWLDERERWWSRHFLSAGADGATLPNLSLIRGDDRLFLEWTPVAFPGPMAPAFLSAEGCHGVGWAEGKDILASFVSCVAQWLRDGKAGNAYSWACLEDPIREAVRTFPNTLQAYTGIAVDVLRQRTAASNDAELREKLGLQADETDPGGSVVTQVLRDLPPRISDAERDQVRRLERETRSGTGFVDELRTVALDGVRAASAPESEGYLAALGLRDHLDLDGRAIGDVDDQLGEFGIQLITSDAECSHGRMLAGLRRGCGAVAIINRTPRTSTPWGRRFEAVRALGHLLMDPYRRHAVGAASASFAQPWTRRRAGAFAAEFLLPSEALRENQHSLDSYAEPGNFQGIMDRYGVGARTTAYHLWNRGFLSSTQVRDDLIEQFADVRYR